MVLSQNKCDILLLVLGKTFVVLWALAFIVMGIYGPYIGISMLASGVENLLPGIIILIFGGSALVAVIYEFWDHRFRLDRYFIGSDDEKRRPELKCRQIDPSVNLTVRIYKTPAGHCWSLVSNDTGGDNVFVGTQSQIARKIRALNFECYLDQFAAED